MARRWLRCRPPWSLVAGLGIGVFSATPASAQLFHRGQPCPPPCPAPEIRVAPPVVIPRAETQPSAEVPWRPAPATTVPPATAPSTAAPVAEAPSLAPQALTSPPELGSGLALGGNWFATQSPGYIDSAIPLTQFRLRFDAAYDNNRPDRAEFFYGKCGCFREAGIDRSAPGPRLAETRVDYQEVMAYLEVAATERLSGFVEIPFRFINPEQNDNSAGLGDINAGVKWALVANEDRFVTFQFRAFAPSGDADRGLGTDHVSLEPALLLRQRLGDRLALDAELRDWIAVDGTDFAGNVLRYGVGLSYLAVDRPGLTVTPVAEFVGWTVLDGQAFGDGRILDASDDTIVNVKLGVRVGFGPADDVTLRSRSDLYVGYGRALTGEVWYKDMLRVEYRVRF